MTPTTSRSYVVTYTSGPVEADSPEQAIEREGNGGGEWEAVPVEQFRAATDIADPSDEYHPVLGFDGEASDTFEMIVNQMHGYGVTLTMEGGEKVDAILLGLSYNDQTDRQEVRFYRVEDGEYPTLGAIPPGRVEQAFVRRIQID